MTKNTYNENAPWLGLLGMGLIALIIVLAILPPRGQKPADPGTTATAVQTAVSEDPGCYVERDGDTLLTHPQACNEPQSFPWCPAEDSPIHAGEPCFWRSERGLIWSDGQSNE